MRYFDTFSGIGGFTVALAELGHECVGFSEIDRYACAIYARHFPSHHPYGDITRINADQLPDFDLLVGGFPCQAFSVAGKRRGFTDTRGTLFFDLARILQAKQPRLFVFENVKGLLSHDGGRTVRTVIAALDELGYDLQWQVLNSKDFGVPQNRERVFIVGHLGGTPRPEVFPVGGAGRERALEEEGTPGRILRQPALHGRGSDTSELLQHGRQTSGRDRAQEPPGDRPERRAVAGVIGADGIASPRKAGVRGVPGGEGLDHISGNIRRLTPLECERLQGFPDNWTAGVSDTQRYRCCGNAVTVNVVREIVRRL